MTVITRNERDYLITQGFKLNVDIFKSHSRHPKYYMVCSSRALEALEKYRNPQVNKQWTELIKFSRFDSVRRKQIWLSNSMIQMR